MASDTQRSGWRGVGLVAVTYVYFLIFAQFAFLQRLAQLQIEGDHLKAVMAMMAAGGIVLSLVTPRVRWIASPQRRLQIAFALCGAAAALTLLPLTLAASLGVSLLIGSSLGVLTVTLVAHLRLWLSERFALMQVGLGTGVGYLICNLPPLFTASPQLQTITAVVLCGLGVWLAAGVKEDREEIAQPGNASRVGFVAVVLGFTALVWLDSAAFFIIQNTPELKAGTWEGTLHLSLNGALHMGAALASAWLLRRRGLSLVLAMAWAALACACLLLLDPHRAEMASLFYPVGVSLYSVALTAYPSLLAPAASAEERGRKAGWIYAIAGWGGSAMGIGMGQHLGRVPVLFVACAGLLLLAPQAGEIFRSRGREVGATVALLLIAFGVFRLSLMHAVPQRPVDAIERGRRVYIAEGCINCHSQYVRPGSRDVLMWGPTKSVDALRAEEPPLIGNRRQGPDLSEVGSRRSALWMRLHFMDPPAVSFHSFMPSFAYLFRDGRGDDVIAYLQSLHAADVAQHQAEELRWLPSSASVPDAAVGARLFHDECATCHTAGGVVRERWAAQFSRVPPVLTMGPLRHLAASDSPAQRLRKLEQITKFGLPGTDMPGHEYLPDQQVASISVWLAQSMAAAPQPIYESASGENR